MSTLRSLARRDLFVFTGASVASLAARSAFAAAPAKIGTIGGGRVASNLGEAWIKAGHQVMFSSRHPEELKDLVEGLGSQASAGTVAETIQFGDIILLAVPYGALPEIAKEHGAALAKKLLVLDATNPFPDRDGEVATKARNAGVGTYTAQMFPGVRIVRAFNAIPAARMSHGGAKDGAHIGVPMTGDDKKAIALAMDLIHETGYEPVLVGPTAFGKYLMPGTPLAGEHSPDDIRKIAATLR